jgi:hypothetical protein
MAVPKSFPFFYTYHIRLYTYNGEWSSIYRGLYTQQIMNCHAGMAINHVPCTMYNQLGFFEVRPSRIANKGGHQLLTVPVRKWVTTI